MKYFLIILPFLLGFIASKPITKSENGNEATTATNDLTSTTYFYNPTTPRDAATRFTLSYLQNEFPEKPELDTPFYDPNDQPPAEKKPVKRSVSTVESTSSNANKQFFNNVFNAVRPIRATQPNDPPQISLGNLVHAIEHGLVNQAAHANRKARSVIDSMPINIETVHPFTNSQNVPLLAPIAVTLNGSLLNGNTEITTASNQLTQSVNPSNDIAIVQTINSTQYVSNGKTIHVQDNKLREFTVSPNDLLTIQPGANLANLAESTTSVPQSILLENSSEPSSIDSTITTTTNGVNLLEKTKNTSQKLQETLAKVSANPVILAAGIPI